MENNPKKSKALIITFIITMILLGGLYYIFANREKLFTPKSSNVENKNFAPLDNNGSKDNTNTGDGNTSNKGLVRIPGSVVNKNDLNKLTTTTDDTSGKNFVTKSFQAVSNTVSKASDTIGGFVKSLFGVDNSNSSTETISIPGTIIAENDGVVTIAIVGVGFDSDNNPLPNPTINIPGTVVDIADDVNVFVNVAKPVATNTDNTLTIPGDFGNGDGTGGGNLDGTGGFGTPIDDPNGPGSDTGGFGSGDTGGFGNDGPIGGGFGPGGGIQQIGLPTPGIDIPPSNTKPVIGISLPNTPKTPSTTEESPSVNMCPEDDPLTFTADEQKQLDDLLRQFYKLTPFLKTEEEVQAEKNSKLEYDKLVAGAKELTSQCKEQKIINPETGDMYTGPQEVKDNPYYQGKKKSIFSSQKTIQEKIEECNSIYASTPSQDTPSNGYDYFNSNYNTSVGNNYDPNSISAIHEADREKCMQDAYNTTNQVDYTDSYLGSLNFEYWTPSRPQKTSEPYKTFEEQFNIW